MWTVAVSEMGKQYVWTLYMPNGTAYDNGTARNRSDALAQARRSLRDDRINNVCLEV